MAASNQSGVRWTIAGVLLFMTIVVTSFIHRVGEPRIMSLAETRANGLFLFDTPRDVGDFSLTDHRGLSFSRDDLRGRWTLIFFGFTHCPDICPTSLLDMVVAAEQTAVDEALVFVSIDPARDTPETLAAYAALFSGDLTGFTGSPEAVEAVKADWAVYAARQDDDAFSDYLMDHMSLIFLTDAEHRVVETCRSGTPPEALALAIEARFSSNG